MICKRQQHGSFYLPNNDNSALRPPQRRADGPPPPLPQHPRRRAGLVAWLADGLALALLFLGLWAFLILVGAGAS